MKYKDITVEAVQVLLELLHTNIVERNSDVLILLTKQEKHLKPQILNRIKEIHSETETDAFYAREMYQSAIKDITK